MILQELLELFTLSFLCAGTTQLDFMSGYDIGALQ